MEETKIIERLTVLETKVESMDEEIKELKMIIEEMHKISTNIALMTEQMKNINEDVKDLKEDVQTIQNEPADKWALIVKTIMTAVVSAIVAYVITCLK